MGCGSNSGNCGCGNCSCNEEPQPVIPSFVENENCSTTFVYGNNESTTVASFPIVASKTNYSPEDEDGPLSECEQVSEALDKASQCIKELKDDAVDASEVTYSPTIADGPLSSAETSAQALDLTNQCLKDIKDGSIFDFSIDDDNNITWTVDGVSTTISVSTPVVRLRESADGSEHRLFVNGILIDTIVDSDTISPTYTIGEDVNGDTILLADGVQVGNSVPDSDTVSPALSFAPNASNGTDVLIGGAVVYTIPDKDTISPEMTFAPNPNGGTDVSIDGTLVYTIPDNDTISPQTTLVQNGNVYDVLVGGVSIGEITTIPDTDTNTTLVTGTQTINADGSIEQCFTTVAADGSFPNGADDQCFTLPAPTDNDALDCDDSALGGKNVFSIQMMQSLGLGLLIDFVDSGDGCTPAAPNAKLSDLKLHTYNPHGDAWVYDGAGSWTCKTVNSEAGIRNMPIVSGAASTILIQDPNVDEISGMTDWTTLSINERTYTNTDCVPWLFDYHSRVYIDAVTVAEDNFWCLRLSAGPNNTVSWAGTPAFKVDTLDSTKPAQDMQGYIHTFGKVCVEAGETVTLSRQIEFRAPEFNAQGGVNGQRINIAGGNRVSAHRVKECDLL